MKFRFWKFPLKIQSYTSSTDSWYEKIFNTPEELFSYVKGQFHSEPQYYNLKNTKKWKETGNFYTQTQKESGQANFEGGRYHNFKFKSPQERQWRALEVQKIKNGVIYDGIYVPGFYHWYLNFCPIYDDLNLEYRFADVWDGDIWYMQYCMLAILRGKHIGGVKGRQKGYSYKHMAILCWSYWWFSGTINTVGGYLEDLVLKSWAYLEKYRAHLNSTTKWTRGPIQPAKLKWIESRADSNNVPRGLNSKLAGVTFKQRPDNDVGGPQTFFNYEEPGVSPTIKKTIEFITPAVQKGSINTGTIIACGSVGELEDAEGIKEIFYNPRGNNFYPVKNVWDDDAAEGDECCIFVSEAYNLLGWDVSLDPDVDPFIEEYTGKPFMDEDGNSDVELAKKWIKRQKEIAKNAVGKSVEEKQIAISQKCTSPKEAFDQRTESEWPVAKLRRQQERIKLKDAQNRWDFKPQKGLLEEDENGKVVLNTSNPPPEHEYPIKPEWPDKRGVCTIYEPPIENPPRHIYYAGVDAVEVGTTETSTSVASLDIFRAAHKVKYTDEEGKERVRIEGDKLVFTYRGRFDNADDHNEQMWLAIKLYNAFTYAERNKPNFINYMKRNGKGHYLAKEEDVPMFKDLNIKNGNGASNSKDGFHKGDNTENWKQFKKAGKEYLQTQYGIASSIVDKNGNEEVLKYVTGIDKIDDYWLLEEFIKHIEGKVNVDRMVSFLAALFICKTYEHQGYMKTVDETKKKEEAKLYTPPKPKSLIGGYSGTFTPGVSRKKPTSLI